MYGKLSGRRDIESGFSIDVCMFDHLFFNRGVACCVMSMNSKRGRELVSPLQCFPSIQQRRLGKRNRFAKHGNSQNLMLTDKQTNCNRKWEDMNHDLLIFIMKKIKWCEWSHVDFLVCKSWLSALLDVLFPPGDTLDLRVLDDDDIKGGLLQWPIRRFYHCLMLNLNRRSASTPYTKLILCECILQFPAYGYIAQRLPSLKIFVSPEKISFYLNHARNSHGYPSHIQYRHFISGTILQYWKNLEEVECHVKEVINLAGTCNSVRNLKVIGMCSGCPWVQDVIPLTMSEGFPLLERLSFSSCKLTLTGMALILDSHKNLSFLDMEHTNCGEAVQIGEGLTWPKDLFDMIKRVETFLTWDGKFCPNCSHLYSRAFECSGI